ncbi:MAG TPA: hypothetical protein DCY97_21745 [Marinilabiliales bacterium]|jgi:hypothetical protein|nr:hypothetical protein [Marinilabiliales bacterium]
MIALKLIRINKILTFFRYLNAIFILLPIPIFAFQLTKIYGFWIVWYFVWIVLYIIQYYLLKRYKIIGTIILNADEIEIKENDNSNFKFYVTDSLRISIKYKGYKGQRGNYNILQLPIFTKEGIGSIVIYKGDEKFKYKFLADADVGNKLGRIAKQLEANGGNIDYISD